MKSMNSIIPVPQSRIGFLMRCIVDKCGSNTLSFKVFYSILSANNVRLRRVVESDWGIESVSELPLLLMDQYANSEVARITGRTI